MKCDTLIVGGGLSGLSLASQLHAKGHDVFLVEGRDRLGGRILTDRSNGGYFDLGPAWFWQGQPRVALLAKRLTLEVFEQYAQGALSFEDEQGRLQRGRGFSSMEGSLRIAGGMAALVDGLAAQLPTDRVKTSWALRSLTKTEDGVIATSTDAQRITAQHVVLAMPPRVAAELQYTPALPDQTAAALNHVPTWMAAQAKAVAIYDTPFWRDEGLSGDAMSRVGPMVEIHDASTQTDGPFGLFGFIGVPAHARRNETVLKEAIIAQLVRLFGPSAAQPKSLLIKDWAPDSKTATQLDLEPLYAHPHYRSLDVDMALWDERVLLSGTETAPQFGGYIEGALEAADQTLAALLTKDASVN